MESIPCACCSTFFVPRNKCQIFCSKPGCQKVRKALWHISLITPSDLATCLDFGMYERCCIQKLFHQHTRKK